MREMLSVSIMFLKKKREGAEIIYYFVDGYQYTAHWKLLYKGVKMQLLFSVISVTQVTYLYGLVSVIVQHPSCVYIF